MCATDQCDVDLTGGQIPCVGSGFDVFRSPHVGVDECEPFECVAANTSRACREC